eukprot:gene1256-1572_t
MKAHQLLAETSPPHPRQKRYGECDDMGPITVIPFSTMEGLAP